MDKKGSRSIQPCSKGLVTDSKKNQDGAGGKLWPRGGRRREPTGGSFPPKNEPSRKPVPQRSKTLDKRPKPRGNYYTGVVGGNEIARLEERDAELGSVFIQGSKKQSLNHLLNFHYEPRENHFGNSNISKSGHRWLTTIKHKYNKEQFLQANCQFIVKSSGDYKQYLNSPDTLVDWKLVEQVNVQVSEYPSCPICLYPPVAAKMTRCGHIYCWSCLLHYLALTDKTWRKCPICFEAVHKEDLKSVVSVPHVAFNINETITFKLMKRQRGSLIAYPADEVIKEADDFILNMSETAAANIHSKLLLANKSEVMSIIERERHELEALLLEDESCPEKCFIQEALSLLIQRENDVFNQCDESVSSSSDTPLKNQAFNEQSEDLNATELPSPTKYFYFYQASDGQHIYLHGLNARMLEHTYGSLEKSPKTIIGRIVEKEGGSMTEELRNRLRYLQHLPVTCQLEFAEIKLGEPIISKETLQHFQDQIETRRRKRQNRAREEKRREKRILEENNRKMGKYPTARISLDSPQQFPDFGFERPVGHERAESESTPHSERSLSPASRSSGPTASSSLAGSLNKEFENAGPSFAKMVSSMKKTVPWPELKSDSNSPRLITVTGTKATPKSSNVQRHVDTDPDCEEYVSAPQFNRSFGDAIALALEKAAQTSCSTQGEVSSGKKKKKNKQKVLFATSMAYNGN